VSHRVSEVTTPLLTSLHGSDAQLGLDFRVSLLRIITQLLNFNALSSRQQSGRPLTARPPIPTNPSCTQSDSGLLTTSRSNSTPTPLHARRIPSSNSRLPSPLSCRTCSARHGAHSSARLEHCACRKPTGPMMTRQPWRSACSEAAAPS
jgi:hypothetical protein